VHFVCAQGAGSSTPRQLGSEFEDLSPALLQWLQDRGISKSTLDRNHVKMEKRYCSALKERVDHIAFPYYRDGVVVNVKYRALPKHFTQVKGGQQIFYGYDDAKVGRWMDAVWRGYHAVCASGLLATRCFAAV
jgi:hypothetical protein